MSDKLTEANELCDELAETLSPTPDAVQVTITIPYPFFGEYTLTGAEIAQMAEDEKFEL